MLNFKFICGCFFLSIFFLQPVLSEDSRALAKRKAPMKAFSFVAEGGKASQGECDGERKIPRQLKRLKEFTKAGSYMGSELQSPELKGKNNDEMWKHFFKTKPACNAVLAKTPSSLEESLKNTKPELPSEESIESEDDPVSTETSKSE